MNLQSKLYFETETLMIRLYAIFASVLFSGMGCKTISGGLGSSSIKNEDLPAYCQLEQPVEFEPIDNPVIKSESGELGSITWYARPIVNSSENLE